MFRNALIGVVVAVSLLLTSCYPELSVQQYDKLKDDIKALDAERQQLKAYSEALEGEILKIKTENAAALGYITFLEKLRATQSSEKALAGEFDHASLFKAKDELLAMAEKMGDNEIVYFLGIVKGDNNGQTVAAYNKIMEYCLKKIKQKLERPQ